MTLKTVITNQMKKIAILCGATALAMATGSCDAVYEDLPECEMGVSLKFVYDYNMLRADAFAPEVDCITVLVFDSNGNYVKSETETTDVLMNPAYRMRLALEPGDYHLVAYGGLTCEDATFDFTPDWIKSRATSGTVNDIHVTLPTDANGVSDILLHDLDKRTGGLFFGTLDLSIDRHDDFNGVNRRTETVYMMKDTNNILIMLEELSNVADMDADDYDFTIIDDNFKFDGNNNVIETAKTEGQKIYKPFVKETRTIGFIHASQREGSQVTSDETIPVNVACAEFSTSRLLDIHMDSARLVITTSREHNSDGSDKEIVNIPFITYLAATRSYGATWIKGDREKGISPDQEYLDREDTWSLILFLQKDRWVNTHISVNSWVVRVNNVTLE